VNDSAARDEILRRIRSSRFEGASMPGHSPPDISGLSRVEPAAGSTERFERELTLLGGHLFRARDAAAAAGYVIEVLREHQAEEVVAWMPEDNSVRLLRESIEHFGCRFMDPATAGSSDFVEIAAGADVGISGVDYALAESGALVLLSGQGRPRTVSLLPEVHVAVLRPENILPGLSDLFPLLQSRASRDGGWPWSAVTFITGPSRTADIEMTLVVGVHGPRYLHVILLEAGCGRDS